MKKIANQLEFEKGDQVKQKIDSIFHGIIFAEEAVNDKKLGLYYLIPRKKETHMEDTGKTLD